MLQKITITIFLLLVSLSDSNADPFDHLSDHHKQLIHELVLLTEDMEPFRNEVRAHYHERIFVPTEKMFAGTILESDQGARDVMNTAIDSVLDRGFDEGLGIKYVHYQSFSPHYDETELEELVKFYRTGVGKKTMESMSSFFEEWEENRYRWAVSLRSEVKAEVKVRLSDYHQKKLAEAESARSR